MLPALIYLALVNAAAFAAMGLDKWKARHDRWRIRERTLFLLAILGGCPGAILGILLFRHKTRHWYFRYGLPAILLLQLAAAWAVRRYLM